MPDSTGKQAIHADSAADTSLVSFMDKVTPQPPCSLEELRTSVEQTRKAINEIDPRNLIPESEIGRFWSEMR